MTPKERAVDLYDKFYVTSQQNREITKKLLIVCVMEIIEQWDYIDTYLGDGRGELNPNLKYWCEVKKECELL